MGNITDEKYYEFRKEIRKLYKNDVRLNGDLCSKILEIRDKERCVEYINVSLADFNISIEVSEDTPEDKTNSIVDTIIRRISKFIADNINELNITDRELFTKFIDPSGYLLCDVIVLGKSITIYL